MCCDIQQINSNFFKSMVISRKVKGDAIMCVFSFGSRCADFGRYVIDRQNALHRIFWSKTSFSFRTVASSHCAIHRLRRSLAALLLSLPLLLGLAVSAQAQVLISNIGQTGAGDANGLLTAARTQDFTTGSHVKGYTVRSLDIVFHKNNLSDLFRKNNPRLTVTIRNASGNNPGTTVVGRLNLPASSPKFSSPRTITFTAPAKGIKLSPSTKYFVVIELDASRSIGTGAGLRLINSDAENPGGAAGFSIGNRDAAYTWWSDPPIWGTGPTSFQMSVNGIPNPITDLIQMKNAKRRLAEFGNHKANGGARFVVEIGDGMSPKGYARTINYTVDGDADRGDGKDYTIDGCTSSTCTVRLPANRHSAVITIYVNNEDGLDENDETIVLTLKDGDDYTVNDAKNTTTVTIADDDTRGLTFHRTWPDVQEGDSVTYTVKLASQPTAAVTVNIASNNQDVTTTPTSLTFNPSGSNLWSTARTVTIDAAQDDDAVDDEAILTHTTSGGDYGGANALSIDRPVSVDDDETAAPVTSNLPRISLDGGSAVTEGAAASFTVNADPAPTSSLTVSVEVIEPPGQDFVAASEERVRTVTLNAGATSATFTVPTVDDNTDEDDGTVQVFVNAGTGYEVGQGAAVTVLDNDGTGPPSVSFALSASSAAENAGTRNVTVNLSALAPSGGLTLNYSVSGTATAGSGNDFTIQNSGTLTIAVGANTASIPVAINDDSATESTETVILTLTGGTGYTVGSPSVHTLTVTDNDNTTPTTPSLTLNPTEIDAGSLDGVTITLMPVNVSFFGASVDDGGGRGNGSSVNPRTYLNSNDLVGNAIPFSAVRLSALGLGKITLSGAPAGLTIASGRLLARQTNVPGFDAHRSVEITLAYSGSSIGADDPVTITVGGEILRLADGSSTQNLSDISADFTIKAGEVPPAASFASASLNVGENAGTRNVTVNLSAPAPSGGLTLGYSVSGTATSGSGNDFTIQGSGSLTIAAGTTSADISVAIIDDSSAENAETVILTLTGGGSGYRLGSPRVHTLTITDNDSTSAQPSVSFNSASSNAAESAGTRNVTVTISPAPSSGFTLSYGVSGTAAAGNDFTIQNSGTVAVAAGATSASIPIAITDDDTDERDETVVLTLTGGTGYTLGSTTVHTLTITDNDDQPDTPALQLPSNTLSVSEGGTGSYTLRLSSQPTAAVTVNIASNNQDVTVSPASLTFNPSGSNLWSTTQTVTVSAAQDVDTINDFATLTHTASGGDYGSVTGLVTVTVNDDDTPAVSFVSPTSSVAEGDGSNDVTVNLSLVAPVGGLTLGYRVTGTATPGSDFTIQNSGTLTVTAGARTATIPVVIRDDSTPENAETVILTLTGGAGYTLGSSITHTLTISNDDGHEVSFASAEDQVREGEDYTVAMHVFPAADQDKEIEYTISGTATEGEDYEDLPVMVVVPAGESQAVIRIETITDKEDDSGETVILTLQSDMNQELSLGTPSVHTLTILDSKEAIVEAGRSWLVRFGRSVAEQVVDSISQRLRATRTEGTQVSVAGAQVPIGQSRAFGTFEPPTTNRPIDDFDTHSQTSAQGSTQTLSEREVIQSSSFMSVSESDAQGGSFAVWGRAAHSSFEGREDKLSLDGDSTSVMLGADYAQQYWQAGATLIQSEGKGEYRDEVISGDAEASITSIVPWAAVQATERVQLWGALGTGDGDLELTEEDSDTLKTNIDWSMAAAGLRSVLVPASGQNGLQLSLVGDALWVETKADPIEGLSITDTDASRLRLGLEGEYASELSSGAEMISRLEFGIREDSGDAETGGGIEIGGGVAWRDASSGLKIELAGRKLLTYDADELEDEGFSLSFDYDPAPDSAEGLSLSLNQEVGVRAKGGLEAVFDSEPLATRTDGEKENRIRLEAAYGVPILGGRFIGSPNMGLGLATGSREYSLGWKVTPERHAPDLSFGVRATRTESDALLPAHAIRFETVFRW